MIDPAEFYTTAIALGFSSGGGGGGESGTDIFTICLYPVADEDMLWHYIPCNCELVAVSLGCHSTDGATLDLKVEGVSILANPYPWKNIELEGDPPINPVEGTYMTAVAYSDDPAPTLSAGDILNTTIDMSGNFLTFGSAIIYLKRTGEIVDPGQYTPPE